MIAAKLTREASQTAGTFGTLTVKRDGEILQLHTLEPPWRDNRQNVSCIPTGSYRCEFGPSGKGALYHVLNVPHRDGILMHVGNWAGDETEGLRSDSEGCILVGIRVYEFETQIGISGSAVALDKLHKFTGKLPFQLDIQWRV